MVQGAKAEGSEAHVRANIVKAFKSMVAICPRSKLMGSRKNGNIFGK